MKILTVFLFSLLLFTSSGATVPPHSAIDARTALKKAREAAEAMDYSTAYEILGPFLGGNCNEALNWEINAEAGRAAFSLGDLENARKLLREVVAARPSRPAPAIYLEATSYILGDQQQAMAIFEALLQAGTQDLYLAVSLPGEQRFLADPEVRSLLKQYALPLRIRPETGEILNIHLSQGKREVEATLGLAPTREEVLAARAGPKLIWLFSFDRLGMLREAILHADNLAKYSPYDLQLIPPGKDGETRAIGWHDSPSQVIDRMGPPSSQSREADGALRLRWDLYASRLDLIFTGSPRGNPSRGHLALIRLVRPDSTQRSRPQDAP